MVRAGSPRSSRSSRPGGAYAGRLSGFDTRGSDWVYCATDLAPFGLALFPGFWWLRRAARAGRAVGFGAALPAAFGPLLSLTGDAYEMGSLVVVHLPFWRGQRGLVGDDLVAKVDRDRAPRSSPAWLPESWSAALLGLLWALVWMFLARRLAAQARRADAGRSAQPGPIAGAGSG